MSNNGDFSLEDSEELIANLKSGKPSDFEQLRSALNLVAHVTELPPTSLPPILPSGIAQPIPVIPVKPANPRRTIVTSVIVIGMFASASLAAAAVTGIGPAAIVNVGHQAAKLVKGIVGGVTQVVTGNSSDASQNEATGPSLPSLPSTSPVTSPPPLSLSNTEDSDQSDSEHLTTIIPALANLFPPTLAVTNSHEDDSQKPNSSQETQGSTSEDSSPDTNSDDKELSKGEDHNLPIPLPSLKKMPDTSEQESNESTPAPSLLPSSAPSLLPSAEPTSEHSSESPSPSPSPSDQPSSDD